MEVVMPMPSPDMDFDFSGARTSPYLSAPSSPKRFGEYYISAPTSPSRLSEFYRDFHHFSIEEDVSSSSIAFGWEEKPAGTTTKGASIGDDDDDNDFAFFVSQESEKSSRSAEELFDGGKIKPFKPPSRLGDKGLTSPRQPRSSITQGKEIIVDAFSPNKLKKETELRRGRERTPAAVLSSSNSGRRVTRSHSPYRFSHNMWEEEQKRTAKEEEESSSDSRPVVLSNASSSKSSRKWSLRDFLLFRSASEGRGASKDTLRKYFLTYRKLEDGKSSSFRSTDSHSSASVHGSRRRGPISAHELHYTMKKAESQDLKKKTFLPYKQGILGRLAGLGSFTK